MRDILQKEVERLSPYYETKQALMLPVLRKIQQANGYISPESEKMVAELLDVPLVKVREVTSFYNFFRDKPVGKKRISMCRTTSCWLRGGEEIANYIMEKLGIGEGETTPDGQFSYESVECLCACENAPMLSINDRYFGPLNIERVDQILEAEGKA